MKPRTFRITGLFLVILTVVSCTIQTNTVPEEETQAIDEVFDEELIIEIIEPSDDWLDYGDAPDGEETEYLAGASEGLFPVSSTSGGPSHQLSGRFWLGESISPEESPVTFADSADDGLLFLELSSCETNSALILVNVSGLDGVDRADNLFLNLYFDWNRDGQWEGEDSCAPEWAVQNYAIDLSEWDPETQFVLEAPEFAAGEQDDEVWLRLLLTDEMINEPLGAFDDGETEDYLYQSESLPEVASVFQLPMMKGGSSQPTFTCDGVIVPHGTEETTFTIKQTQKSKGRVVSSTNFQLIPPKADRGFRDVTVVDTSVERTEGIYEAKVEVVIASNVDSPERIEGPFDIAIFISGSFEGAKKGEFTQYVKCSFYVIHSDVPGSLSEGAFMGAPEGVSTGSIGGSSPTPKKVVVRHGTKKTIPISTQGGYNKGTMKVFSGPWGEAAIPKTQDEAKVSIQTPKSGRAIRIKPKKDGPERVEVLMIIVEGVDGNGNKITDVYRVFAAHTKSSKVRKLLEGYYTKTAMNYSVPSEPGSDSEYNWEDVRFAVGSSRFFVTDLRALWNHLAGMTEFLIDVQVFRNHPAPLPDATVTVSMTRPDGTSETLSANTDENGIASLKFNIYVYGTYTFRVENVEGEGMTYTPELNSAESITVKVVGGTSPTFIGDERIVNFYNGLNTAFRSQDVLFLYNSLYPSVGELYGDDYCWDYLESIINSPIEVSVKRVTDFGSWDWDIDGQVISIEYAYMVEVQVKLPDGTTANQITHLALRDDASLSWLTDCGEPLP